MLKGLKRLKGVAKVCPPPPPSPLPTHTHRPYWRCYYANTDAIIYVVDSADRDRLAISKSELVSMLEVSWWGQQPGFHLGGGGGGGGGHSPPLAKNQVATFYAWLT